MALAKTTLSAAITATQTSIVVASATGFAARQPIRVDEEIMVVGGGYTTGTTIPVRRGQDGTAAIAHATTASVVTGAGSDFASPAPQTAVQYPIAGRARRMVNYAASGAIALPTAGSDQVAVLNGTSALAMTLAVPTKDMDGTLLWVVSDGAAAHTVTVTGGIGGAGTSYDVITLNGTGPTSLGPLMAVNSLWMPVITVPLAGTVTNITGTVA